MLSSGDAQECRAAMFTGLGSVFYKGQDRSFHLCQAAAGHGAPGSLLVFHTLSQQGSW